MLRLISPRELLFLILLIGFVLIKINPQRVSLDVSTILIVAVIAGFGGIASNFIIIDDAFQNQMSFLSSIGTSIFVAVVGLQAGQSMVGNRSKGKNAIYFVMGMLTVCIGFACMSLIFALDTSVDVSMMYGVYCGAMTSTPGLTTVCELTGVSTDLATIGYSCSYLFGVIGVVIFVQWLGRKKSTSEMLQNNEVSVSTKSKSKDELLYICLVAVCGMLLGGLVIPVANISLGNSGGILCAGIIIGFCLAKRKTTLDQSALSIYRTLGLVMFFVGTGVPAGARLVGLPSIKYLIYGAVITIIPVALIYMLCRGLLKLSILDAISIVSGGMTSTPAIGILLKDTKKNLNLSPYSMSYVGALLMIVLLFKTIEMIRAIGA